MKTVEFVFDINAHIRYGTGELVYDENETTKEELLEECKKEWEEILDFNGELQDLSIEVTEY